MTSLRNGGPGAAQLLDLGIEVAGDEVDAVLAGGCGVRGPRAPELAGPESSNRKGPLLTSAKAGRCAVRRVKPR